MRTVDKLLTLILASCNELGKYSYQSADTFREKVKETDTESIEGLTDLFDEIYGVMRARGIWTCVGLRERKENIIIEHFSILINKLIEDGIQDEREANYFFAIKRHIFERYTGEPLIEELKYLQNKISKFIEDQQK